MSINGTGHAVISILPPVDHGVLNFVSGQRLNDLLDIPLRPPSAALVNISSITRDRPAGKKLKEDKFSKVSSFQAHLRR